MNICLMDFITWIHSGGPGSWLKKGPVGVLDLLATCWLPKDKLLLGVTNFLYIVVAPTSMTT